MPGGSGVVTDLDDIRSRMESAIHAYRENPDPALLAIFHEHKLQGIAFALKHEATGLPGIGKDSATDRINRWLRPSRAVTSTERAADDRAGFADGFGLGAPSPTG